MTYLLGNGFLSLFFFLAAWPFYFFGFAIVWFVLGLVFGVRSWVGSRSDDLPVLGMVGFFLNLLGLIVVLLW